MPKATLIFEDREVLADASIVEMRIWRVPRPVSPSTHLYKYALFFGYPGGRVVGFDNERGKGDHKHVRSVESPYIFRGPRQSIEDFRAAIQAARDENS